MTERIDELLYAGRLDEASRLITEGLAATPEDAGLRVANARLRGAEGDGEAAMAELDRALRADPDYLPAHGYRGIMLYEADRGDEALEALKKAIDGGVKDGAIHFCAARGAAAGGDMDGALAHCDNALADQPENAAFAFTRARLLSDLGRFDQSMEALRRSIELDPTQEDPWIVLCSILLNLGEAADAVANLRQALRQLPESDRLAELLAHAALSAGDVETATLQLEALAKSHPKDPTTLGNLALCYVAGGRAKMAESVYRDALTVAPEDAVLHYQLGSLLEDRDGIEALRDAVDHYVAAIEHDAEMWEPLSDLGRLYITQAEIQDLTKGMSLLERALVIAGERPEILMNRALGYAHNGDNARGIRDCRLVEAHADADGSLKDQAHALVKHLGG